MLSLNTLSGMTDNELIQRYKLEGDLAVLGELFKRYSALVYGVCLKYLKSREDARDAAMEVYEKLTKSLLHHEVSYFKGWLYATVRNHCLMQLRAKKGKPHEELPPFLMETDGGQHLDGGDELEGNLVKLEKCLEKLAAEQQQCVRLFFLEERCYAEVSQATGFTMNQVKSYIQNGKRNLKICMDKND
jgi:RNA polymerase sigma-70 factor (ECF subfamily)